MKMGNKYSTILRVLFMVSFAAIWYFIGYTVRSYLYWRFGY